MIRLIRHQKIALLAILLLSACQPKVEEAEELPANPAATGFNSTASDSLAVAWADAVMEAMGGRKQWDSLRYVAWNFFGARDLIWDKNTGRVRIDFPADSAVYLLDMSTDAGKVLKNGIQITQPDSLAKYLTKAKSIWINDSYWLFMPFKLKDRGVTLKYLRSDTTAQGVKAEVLQLTFDEVGNTPENKYEIYIDKSDSLVKQWAYFREASQDSATATWPWDNFRSYAGLLLSADRSDNLGPKKVRVYDTLPDTVFESFEVPKLP